MVAIKNIKRDAPITFSYSVVPGTKCSCLDGAGECKSMYPCWCQQCLGSENYFQGRKSKMSVPSGDDDAIAAPEKKRRKR